MRAASELASWRTRAESLVWGLFVILICLPGVARAQGPAVVRTMTHHQLTAFPRGVIPIDPAISDNGERVAFVAMPTADEPPRVHAVNFDGSGLVEIDRMGVEMLDISGDGKTVVYHDRRELRLYDGGTPRTIVQIDDPNLISARLAYDGRRAWFVIARNSNVKQPDGTFKYADRGVYRVDNDGKNLRRLAGPDEVAKLLDVKPDDVGINFRTSELRGSLAVSNAGRCVFGEWVRNAHYVFGCEPDGGGLHVVATTGPQTAEPPTAFAGVGLSGDGGTAAYFTVYPEELGVVPFAGGARKVLGKTDPRVQYGSGELMHLSYDGSRLTRLGRCYATDGGGSFPICYSLGQELIAYWRRDAASMSARGVHFAYPTLRVGDTGQLATIELNKPTGQLGEVPRIAQITLEPAAIPRNVTEPLGPAKLRAAVAMPAGHAPGRVYWTAFLEGFYDSLVGGGAMLDDGRTDGDGRSGDLKAGDGVYSAWRTYAQPQTPDGPRTIRVDALSTDPNQLWHGHVVEVGPYPVVNDLPIGPAPPIEVTPPAQPPPVTPPPPTIDDSIVTGPGGGTGPGGTGGTGGTGTGGGTSTGGTGTGGPLDLTGLWKDDAGAPYALRQVGSKLYWSHEGLPKSRNVFFGDIAGSAIAGEWYDLPGGALFDAGKLTWKIETPDKLVKTGESSPYGTTTLTRVTSGPSPGGIGTTPGGPGGGTGGAGTGAGPGGFGPGGTEGGPFARGPCANPRVLQLMDQWLAAAVPPQKPGESLRYEPWGRLVGKSLSATLTVNGKPDTPLPRCEYLWERADQLNSTNLGTLKDYVLKNL